MTVAGQWSWHPSVTRRQFSASSSDFNQEFIKSSQNYQSKSRGVHIVSLPAMSHVCQDILTKRDEGFQMYHYTCMEGKLGVLNVLCISYTHYMYHIVKHIPQSLVILWTRLTVI